MLAAHASQREWLAKSQGDEAYVATMEEMGRRVGEMSGRFAVAEGWRRRNHLGFGAPDFDPLTSLLGEAVWVDPAYEASLD
jgi:hypothetical protein